MRNVEELEEALEYPWEKWTIFLHPAQLGLVERNYNGPTKVSGSAGTGKTVVALHRAAFLAKSNFGVRILLTTFSDALANLLRTKLELLIHQCGAILAGSACQNAVASALSPWDSWNNLRQYLREWLYDGSDRTSPCQTQLDVTLCFAPLLRWVLAWWRSGRLALAIDPTLKGDQTTAIVISVLYRSCAIPVAWRIHRATQKGSWMDPTVELLRELAPAVPKEMTVIVLCDRGISSPKLWQQIRAQGWHPCMRYRKNITFCAQDGRRLPARAFVSVPDTAWIGHGTAFGPPTAQRRCTLLAV